jgi:hypothetical protein
MYIVNFTVSFAGANSSAMPKNENTILNLVITLISLVKKGASYFFVNNFLHYSFPSPHFSPIYSYFSKINPF